MPQTTGLNIFKKYLEKGTKSDVREDVVCSIPAGLGVRLLPKTKKLLLLLTHWTQIKYVFSWCYFI